MKEKHRALKCHCLNIMAFCNSLLGALTTTNTYSPRASAHLPSSSRNPVQSCSQEEEFRSTFFEQIWETRGKRKDVCFPFFAIGLLEIVVVLTTRPSTFSSCFFFFFLCAVRHHGRNSQASHYRFVFVASF